MRQGEPADHVLVLTAGEVAIVSPVRGGGELVHTIIRAGQLIGELALLNDGRRTAGARATPTTAWAIGRDPFWGFLEANPAASSALLRQVAARLASREALIDDLLSLDVKSRLAKALLGLAASHGEPDPDGGTRISLRLTHRDLAGMVGASRENVTGPWGVPQGAASSTTTPTPSGCATPRPCAGSLIAWMRRRVCRTSPGAVTQAPTAPGPGGYAQLVLQRGTGGDTGEPAGTGRGTGTAADGLGNRGIRGGPDQPLEVPVSAVARDHRHPWSGLARHGRGGPGLLPCRPRLGDVEHGLGRGVQVGDGSHASGGRPAARPVVTNRAAPRRPGRRRRRPGGCRSATRRPGRGRAARPPPPASPARACGSGRRGRSRARCPRGGAGSEHGVQPHPRRGQQLGQAPVDGLDRRLVVQAAGHPGLVGHHHQGVAGRGQPPQAAPHRAGAPPGQGRAGRRPPRPGSRRGRGTRQAGPPGAASSSRPRSSLRQPLLHPPTRRGRW